MPVEVEARRVDEEQVRAQHEIEGAVEERQQRQRRAHIATMPDVAFVVGEKPRRGGAAVLFGRVEGRKCFETEQPPLLAHLFEHARVVVAHAGGQFRLGPVVERIDGDRVHAALARFDGEGRRARRDIEHGLAAQSGGIKGEEPAIFVERAPEEGDGGEFQGVGGGRPRPLGGTKPFDGHWGWRCNERGHGMMLVWCWVWVEF